MRKITPLVVFAICSISFGQTNLMDSSSWSQSTTGNVTGFTQRGPLNENLREMGASPHGTQELLWKVLPTANSPDNYNGGWNGSDYITIDPDKTYRFTVWMKKLNSVGGTSYLGFYAMDTGSNHTSLRLDGSLNSNPYFFSSDLPILDEWYLVVGFLHKSSHTSDVSIGGIYNTSGAKVANTVDYKFGPTAARILHKSFLVYDTTPGDELHLYAPTIYEVDINNQQPSIQALVDGPNGPGPGSGTNVWTKTNSTISYTEGFVGIGTSAPDAPLTVNGRIHTTEVKVDASVPAPDYVFYKDYNLRTLEEVQQYITENGHLPNIPSAKEIEANGIELGLMNMKLLEKIEELTLYILEQDKKQEQQKQKQRQLEKRIEQLETQN